MWYKLYPISNLCVAKAAPSTFFKLFSEVPYSTHEIFSSVTSPMSDALNVMLIVSIFITSLIYLLLYHDLYISSIQHIKTLKGGDDMKRDGTAYYPVLESEIILRKISKKDIYSLLCLQANTFTLKLNGNLRFSLDEAIRIQETFFSDVSVNQLFRHE
nr:MAG TPA: hypothetical protein [Caudoviricetes sp.]